MKKKLMLRVEIFKGRYGTDYQFSIAEDFDEFKDYYQEVKYFELKEIKR